VENKYLSKVNIRPITIKIIQLCACVHFTMYICHDFYSKTKIIGYKFKHKYFFGKQTRKIINFALICMGFGSKSVYIFTAIQKATGPYLLICLCIEICALLGYYAASCGNCLPTFRDNVLVPSSRVSYSDSWPLKMGLTRCPETSVNNYHTAPRNIPEERRSHQHRDGSLKSMPLY
jgi:hypothetical protein